MYMSLIVWCHYLVEIIQPRFGDPNVGKLLGHQLRSWPFIELAYISLGGISIFLTQ